MIKNVQFYVSNYFFYSNLKIETVSKVVTYTLKYSFTWGLQIIHPR